MGSMKGQLKKLRAHEIVLPVAKGSKPMTSEEINDYFNRARALRSAEKQGKR